MFTSTESCRLVRPDLHGSQTLTIRPMPTNRWYSFQTARKAAYMQRTRHMHSTREVDLCLTAADGLMLPACCRLHVAPFTNVGLVERQTGRANARELLRPPERNSGTELSYVCNYSHIAVPLAAYMAGFWGATPFGVDLSPLAFHAPRKHFHMSCAFVGALRASHT